MKEPHETKAASEDADVDDQRAACTMANRGLKSVGEKMLSDAG